MAVRAMTVLNVKMNCIALTSAQARLTMMFAAMRQPDNRPLHDAAWRAFERAKVHDDLALRLASLRVVDALLHQRPPDRGDLALCGLEVEWQAPSNTAQCP
jgi:hypothetical protein